MKYNLVFFASPEFSADILKHLLTLDFLNVRAVVTNPDKPLGRKQIMTPTPVAQLAESHHLPVFKPAKLDDANLSHLKLFDPHIFFVVAYGKIIPQSYLDVPSIATLNVHYSLLPKYRGALCVKEAILNGDKTTGTTLLEMDALMDHGAIISQHTLDISPTHTVDTLTKDLTNLSIKHLAEDLSAYLEYKTNGTTKKTDNLFLPPLTQGESQATTTKMTRDNNRANSFIPFDQIKEALTGNEAKVVDQKIRANTPSPGAWTKVQTQKGEINLNILSSHMDGDRLAIDSVQIPGKNPISWKQFTSGYTIQS